MATRARMCDPARTQPVRDVAPEFTLVQYTLALAGMLVPCVVFGYACVVYEIWF